MYVADDANVWCCGRCGCCERILRDQYTAKSNLWNVAWAAIIAIYCKGNILHSKYIARPIHSLKSNLWNGLLLLQYIARPHLHFGQNPVTCGKFICLQPRIENSKSEYARHHRDTEQYKVCIWIQSDKKYKYNVSEALCRIVCSTKWQCFIKCKQGSVKTLSLATHTYRATQWEWMRVL